MAYVEIETREGTRRVQIGGDRLSIGRLSYNDVVISHAQISRQHAEMRFLNGAWWIADLHSTNGLHLGTKRIQQHQLRSGDRIELAPGITLRFVDDSMTQDSPGATHPQGFQAEQMAPPPGPPPALPAGPELRALADGAPFLSVGPLGPRSPFADDEDPYIPPGMGMTKRPATPPSTPPTSRPPQGPLFPGLDAAFAGLGDIAGKGPARGDMPPMPRERIPTQSASGMNFPPLTGSPGDARSANGYSSNGPYAEELHDPYRRSAPGNEQSYATAGPGPTLLHICQTCGQRTAPDAVYCHNCHSSIARECPNCRLSLLPIQDRCPRCQMPNMASVRRAHRSTGY